MLWPAGITVQVGDGLRHRAVEYASPSRRQDAGARACVRPERMSRLSKIEPAVFVRKLTNSAVSYTGNSQTEWGFSGDGGE